MSGEKGTIHFNLWWGSSKETAENIAKETYSIQKSFSSPLGSRTAPYDGDVSITTPNQLKDEEVFSILKKKYPAKKITKSKGRFNLEF